VSIKADNKSGCVDFFMQVEDLLDCKDRTSGWSKLKVKRCKVLTAWYGSAGLAALWSMQRGQSVICPQ